MPFKLPNARIDGIIAAAAPLAVVFRRGPARAVQQLVWNLETDEITPGQWQTGRVYTRRCDLSPDGQFLVYACTNYADRKPKNPGLTDYSHHGWTAISRPPYFTALGLWYMGGAWNGGGIWEGRRNVALNNFHYQWETKLDPSPHVCHRTLDWSPSEDSPLFELLLEKRGWTHGQPGKASLKNPDYVDYETLLSEYVRPTQMTYADIEELERLYKKATPVYESISDGRWSKPYPGGRLELIDGKTEVWRILDRHDATVRAFTVPLFGCKWLDVDHRGRVIFDHEGKLWAWENCPEGEPKMIADLNGNQFEAIPPPDWAKSL